MSVVKTRLCRRPWVLAPLWMLAVVWLAAAPVTSGQAPATQARAKTHNTAVKPKIAAGELRTPWGDPDLQGIWNTSTITPLERPKELAGKQFFTEAEAAALEEEATRNQFVDRPRRADAPPAQTVGTYNQLWFDRGTGVVPTRRTSLIVDPPDGRIPLTAEGEKKLAAMRQLPQDGPFNSWVDIDTGERCFTDGLATIPYAYNNVYHILQTPGYVVIHHEQYAERRIIPVDGRPHLGRQIGQWFGDSRGHWEGTTLVVDTTNFADKTHYKWAEPWRASRPTMHLVERFTRIDADSIDYQYTMTDPTMFTKPFTVAVPMSTHRAERLEIFEYACHEGNHAVPNELSGARAQEKAAAKK